MSNSYFQFKQFRIEQSACAMKVTTDACILGAWAPIPPTGNFLDIGAGTGLLALMMAQRSGAVIDAIELDSASFLQAKENVKASNWRNHIDVIHADVKEFLPRKNYDFIICNPPFFEKQQKSSSPKKNIARHDVTLNYHELAIAVNKLSKPDHGKFAILLPFLQSGKFIAEASEQNLFCHHQLLIRDQPAKVVTRCAMLFDFSPPSEIKSEMLSIKDEGGNYTDEFSNLLGEFYMHL